VARVFAASGIRKDELSLWLNAAGLMLEPVMRGCHVAWNQQIRRRLAGCRAIVRGQREWPVSSRHAEQTTAGSLGAPG
jgi:hypothetical protein